MRNFTESNTEKKSTPITSNGIKKQTATDLAKLYQSNTNPTNSIIGY